MTMTTKTTPGTAGKLLQKTEAPPAVTTPTTEETNGGAPIMNLDALLKMAEEARKQREDTLTGLKARRAMCVEEIASIDKVLAELGQPLAKDAVVTPATGAGAVKPPSNRTRGSNTHTHASAVEALCMKYPEGLSRGDITVKVSTEMGYDTKSEDPKKFANNVYTGGIKKCMDDGKIIAVGRRPNTRYKHVQHSTPAEIAEFKASRVAGGE